MTLFVWYLELAGSLKLFQNKVSNQQLKKNHRGSPDQEVGGRTAEMALVAAGLAANPGSPPWLCSALQLESFSSSCLCLNVISFLLLHQ